MRALDKPASAPHKPLRSKLAEIALTAFAYIVGIAIVAAGAFFLTEYGSLSPTKSWYALRSGVRVRNVVIDRVPHDCEFNTAPLGGKHCHYDADVELIAPEVRHDHERALTVHWVKVEE